MAKIMNHDHSPKIPVISLCSGCECFGLALKEISSSFRHIAYCEREAFGIANLVSKMEAGQLDEGPVFPDLNGFPWREFSEVMGEGVLTFGWPCQPVSHAGQRKATEDERWLFDIIANGIEIMRPAVLFAENVEGLLTARMPDGTLVIRHCIERLERLHYCVEIGIFSAEECGAPHRRKRVFILGYREGFDFAGWLRRVMENSNINGDGQRKASESKETGPIELGNTSSDNQSGNSNSKDRQREQIRRSSGELADTQHNAGSTQREFESGQRSNSEQDQNTVPRGSSSGESMAYTTILRERESNDKECSIPRQDPRQDLGRGSNEPSIDKSELVHSSEQRLQGHSTRQCSSERLSSKGGLSPIYWPDFVSRPGQPQHEWEPSRVTLPTSLFNLWNKIRANPPESLRAEIEQRETSQDFIQTLRKMGVRFDGRTGGMDNDSNTDELRLLGNGIYPAAAIKAFLTLSEKLLK